MRWAKHFRLGLAEQDEGCSWQLKWEIPHQGQRLRRRHTRRAIHPATAKRCETYERQNVKCEPRWTGASLAALREWRR